MNKEKVKIYLVDIKGQNGNYFWKDELEQDNEIGDWVIVQNGNSYSLGQVIAEVECYKDEVSRFVRSGYNSIKNIMTRISMDTIQNRYDSMLQMVIGEKRKEEETDGSN